MNIKDTFTKNLRFYVSRSGKTQAEIAYAIGVSKATFSRYMNGVDFPRMDKVQKIADYFGILKSDLIEDKSGERINEKDNDVIANIVVRLKMDKVYLNLVSDLYDLNENQLQSILSVVQSFKNSKN